MRSLLCTLGLTLIVPCFGTAFAALPTAADLDALDRLECFPGNPLIDASNAFTLLAIIPDSRTFAHSRENGRFVRLTRLLHGYFVPHDIAARPATADDPDASPLREVPNVMLITRRSRGRGRFGDAEVVQRRFTDEVRRLRRLLPHARLSCVYDVEKYAAARARCDGELAP